MNNVLMEIANERVNQDLKWGQQNHAPSFWITILAEEVGEAAHDSLEDYWQGYRAEMIQVAAVAVAAIESLDRNELT